MIEWFLSPKDDNERAISYAMKLYGSGQLADNVIDRYLDKDDRNLDRKLKTLQASKLASEQGLDWEDYRTDDSAEENRTAQGAVAYGAKQATPKRSAAVQAAFEAPEMKTVFKAQMARAGVESPGFFFKEAMRDLKALGQSATMGNKAKSILRYASFL